MTLGSCVGGGGVTGGGGVLDAWQSLFVSFVVVAGGGTRANTATAKIITVFSFGQSDTSRAYTVVYFVSTNSPLHITVLVQVMLYVDVCTRINEVRLVLLGVVHNCQHLCIRTERTEGGGGTMPAYYFKMLIFC